MIFSREKDGLLRLATSRDKNQVAGKKLLIKLFAFLQRQALLLDEFNIN
jgi:hypothetical protein